MAVLAHRESFSVARVRRAPSARLAMNGALGADRVPEQQMVPDASQSDTLQPGERGLCSCSRAMPEQLPGSIRGGSMKWAREPVCKRNESMAVQDGGSDGLTGGASAARCIRLVLHGVWRLARPPQLLAGGGARGKRQRPARSPLRQAVHTRCALVRWRRAKLDLGWLDGGAECRPLHSPRAWRLEAPKAPCMWVQKLGRVKT